MAMIKYLKTYLNLVIELSEFLNINLSGYFNETNNNSCKKSCLKYFCKAKDISSPWHST